jgi:hypothetical protein
VNQPTPSQINQAMQNELRPYRTHGAKVRDALLHVQQSRNDKARVRRASSIIGQMNITRVTHAL